MRLHYRKIGEGAGLVMHHGVFGSGDNLLTVAKKIADQGFAVYLVDARNHGHSPHSPLFSYDLMAEDLYQLLEEQSLHNPVLLGHSMGGKVLMTYANKYENFSKLIIVDIASKAYPLHHEHIIEGLNAIDLSSISSRKEAEEIFAQYVTDLGERQFILKNLYRNPEGQFSWRVNVPIIEKEIAQVGGKVNLSKTIEKSTLLLSGGDSWYVTAEDVEQMARFYKSLDFVKIAGANHWVHATAPEEFVDRVVTFIKA